MPRSQSIVKSSKKILIICCLSALSLSTAVCQLTKEGVLHLNLSTPTLCDLPPQTNIRVRSDSISPSTTYILFTVQIPNIPLLVSLEPEPTLDQSINTTSSSVGLVTIFGQHGVVGSWVEWYLLLMFNDTAQIQLFAQPYLLQDKTNRSFSGESMLESVFLVCKLVYRADMRQVRTDMCDLKAVDTIGNYSI